MLFSFKFGMIASKRLNKKQQVTVDMNVLHI